MFATEIGGKETNVIQLGNSTILSSKDELSDIRFVLKCTKDVNQKKMMQVLNKIKNLFINTFTGHLYDADDVQKKLKVEFEDKLNKMLESESNVSRFLEVL